MIDIRCIPIQVRYIYADALNFKSLSRLDAFLPQVTMRFCNVRLLLHEIGSRLTSLTLEMDDEQGQGSEIVFLGRFCPNLTALRILLGDKVLKGEMTLHFGSQFFR